MGCFFLDTSCVIITVDSLDFSLIVEYSMGGNTLICVVIC